MQGHLAKLESSRGKRVNWGTQSDLKDSVLEAVAWATDRYRLALSASWRTMRHSVCSLCLAFIRPVAGEWAGGAADANDILTVQELAAMLRLHPVTVRLNQPLA